MSEITGNMQALQAQMAEARDVGAMVFSRLEGVLAGLVSLGDVDRFLSSLVTLRQEAAELSVTVEMRTAELRESDDTLRRVTSEIAAARQTLAVVQDETEQATLRLEELRKRNRALEVAIQGQKAELLQVLTTQEG